MYRLTI